MNEKILVLNVHSSMNVGDAALLQSAIQQLAVNFPDATLTLSMNNPESYLGAERVLPSIFAWVHPICAQAGAGWKIARLICLLPASLLPVLCQRWTGRPRYWLTPVGLRAMVDAYLTADLVVSAPGGYLYSSAHSISLLIIIYSLALALLAGKPVYLLPQSIGPIQHRWEGHLLRWLLQRVRIVMVREPVSLQLLQACKLRNARIWLLPDMAFSLPAADANDGKAWLCAHGIDSGDGRPRLGMTMINWGAQDQGFDRQAAYEQACAAAARWFVEHTGGRVFFFPQVWGPTPDQDDRIPARRVAKQLSDLTEAILLVEKPLSIEQLKAVYGQMDVFIGTRMHSNIFTIGEAVPVIAIGYQHKTRGIAEMAGLNKWVMDIQQVDEKSLVRQLEALWSNREVCRQELRQVLPDLIHQAEQAGVMVAEDYAGLTQEKRNG
jgi:colanic acid/amylovoran biosynthesis protein